MPAHLVGIESMYTCCMFSHSRFHLRIPTCLIAVFSYYDSPIARTLYTLRQVHKIICCSHSSTMVPSLNATYEEQRVNDIRKSGDQQQLCYWFIV